MSGWGYSRQSFIHAARPTGGLFHALVFLKFHNAPPGRAALG
nr:MAG TPA: hypothetical protein [Caudoviricetes sp.]